MDKKHTIWIDDVSNHEVGVVLQGSLEFSEPEPVVETVRVLGRNGDLHIFDGTYRNRTATVDAFAYRDRRVKEAYSRIYSWLYATHGYRKIRTDDDIDHYLMGRALPSAAMKTRIDRMAPFAIAFDCKPQRFLTIGDEKITTTEKEFVVINPTKEKAYPLINVFPSDDYAVEGRFIEINGRRCQIGFYSDEISAGFVYDAETHSASAETSYGERYVTTHGDVLWLDSGKNTIKIGSAYGEVSIVPRWWEL